MEIIINGEKIRSEMDFHNTVSAALNLSPYYGRNLDALWDVLSADIERPVRLVWMRSDASATYLGGVFYRVVEVLERVEIQDGEWKLRERFELKLK